MQISIKNSRKTIEILYIEDDISDVNRIKKAFRSSRFPIHLTIAEDGETALEMLQDPQIFSPKEKPDIILLDLSLPSLSGLEVLSEIKKNAIFHEIPVLVFDAAPNDQTIRSAYQNHANFFMLKPQNTEQVSGILTYIEKFWLSRIPLVD